MNWNTEKILIDGKKMDGKVVDYHITGSCDEKVPNKATIHFLSESGKDRFITCEAEAVTFES